MDEGLAFAGGTDLLELLLGYGDLGVVVVDNREQVRIWNTWMEVHSHIPARDAYGRSLGDLFPEMEPAHREMVHQVLESGCPRVVSPVLHPRFFPLTGAPHQYVRLFPLRGADLGVVGAAILIQDMTAPLEYERAVEERFRLIVEGAYDFAILMLYPDGTVASWNRGAERLLGYRAEEALGQPYALFFPEEALRQGAPRRCLRQAAEEGRSEDEGWRVRRDGSRFWANTVVTALHHEDGRLRGFALVMRDVTARMEAERAEREQRVLAEALQDTALVLVSTLTLEEVLERILVEAGRVVPHDVAEITVLEPDGGTRVRRKGELPPGEVRCHVGTPIIVKGRTIGFLGLDSATPDAYTEADADRLRAFAAQAGVAIENARLYEEVRRHAQDLEARVAERTAALEAANRELEAFTYSVSHDLRAPLRAIDGFTRAIEEEYAAQLPPQGQYYLRRVRQAVVEMNALIDDLLALSRVSRQAVRRERVEPAALVQEVLGALQKEMEGRRVEIAIGALSPCWGDPVLLRQVWWNLLSNALKFTRKRDPARIEVGAREEGTEVIYFVRDNGVGFDPRYTDRLFRVFERLHPADEYEGTGVGLAIVRRIVERHGGRVWAEGAVDRGATFYFALCGGGAGGSGK